ncbi:MAG: 4Fe-4S binding protein, partial [Synechococcus sp.]
MTDASAATLLLTPYATGRPQRGVVGSSRYAQRLRQELIRAAKEPENRTLMIRGEPGLGKDNLAALVHFGSSKKRRLLVRLQPADLRAKVDPLLDAVGDNTLLVIGVDQLDPGLQKLLAEMASGQRPGFSGRMMFTSETCVPTLDAVSQLIRVPPLRVRRADLGDWLRYQLRLQCPGLGWQEPPTLPETVVRRLQNHDFPDNLRELESLVGRALRQARRLSQDTPPTVLAEEVFWTDQRKERSRFDIWRWKPQLREWMRAPKLWNGLLFGLVSWLFVAVNLALWLGPQTRSENPALNLFWAWWWPLILLSYPLVGRLWCAVCPFMVWGRIIQAIVPWRPRAWPHGETDRWASPLLAAGFAAILVWEEVWNLENTAWLSSCLLLVITAGAVIGSLLFEKRFWCRYLCPVGGMNGLFAKLSILELRAESG